MTEKRKQQLRQLLGEAKGDLGIRDEYGVPLSLPKNLYRSYLKEVWKHYGLDCFSPYWIRLSLDIGCETTKSRLLDFIREELARYCSVGDDAISATTCLIENTSTNCPSVCRIDNQRIHLELILKRLLDIALVLGIGEAVSVFDGCRRPEGAHVFFQDVLLVEGLKVTNDLAVFEGVRLVPLRSSEISKKVSRYLPRFPYYAFLRETCYFDSKTLLVIDRPGFTIFHERGPDGETPLEELPLQIGERNVIIRTLDEIDSLQEGFTQALSLILNHPIQVIYRWFCLGEQRTFNLRHGSVVWPSHANRFRIPKEASEADIEKAKCLHERLVNFNSKDKDKLLIAIDRWIKSKASGSEADKIIDLGKALEALYVTGKNDIRRKLCYRAPLYLGEDVAPQKTLTEEFDAIYDYRSAVVHNRVTGKFVSVGERCVSIADLVTRAQNLCQKSILKIIKEQKFPDWSALRQRAN